MADAGVPSVRMPGGTEVQGSNGEVRRGGLQIAQNRICSDGMVEMSTRVDNTRLGARNLNKLSTCNLPVLIHAVAVTLQ